MTAIGSCSFIFKFSVFFILDFHVVVRILFKIIFFSSMRIIGFLTPVVAEILCFFSLEKQRLKCKTGIWFAENAGTIRS
ncbi:hypothetical protein IA01_06520 [Flavobacterium psychrophilum]|nr:hypothetical protein IA03_06530 [Flavobacterium psychrophilum]AIN72914.1 hypothetical protein FPG101_11375 [Flavobacterium psychrophilum FPG101]AIN75072.1 hypothetical protein FPG3_02710 [Flavobacterium psychrophilum FPG3]OXB10430.1 hypothetical protein B0A57_08380 [Flavobacterium psychrophilum DSM 3660 = ATCC 49418]ROO20635.1 hypothetical protein FPG104_05220 [Flavobacterium psychrophilum 10]